ncbi:hypothetical protein OG749_02875 [Streptomyces nojiriensis]|uniref:hypothetical protein n=1 Tax=Streptomyces nojiriensis TaxID=66374 RepID=UPI002E19D54A
MLLQFVQEPPGAGRAVQRRFRERPFGEAVPYAQAVLDVLMVFVLSVRAGAVSLMETRSRDRASGNLGHERR